MVPMPPGSAMKPSDRSAIVCLRSCIDATTRSSVRPVWASSFFTSACGMTPTTSPRAARTASARMPMSPTFEPPYTNPKPPRASARPRSAATWLYAGRAPGLEPQKTQSRFTRALLGPFRIRTRERHRLPIRRPELDSREIRLHVRVGRQVVLEVAAHRREGEEHHHVGRGERVADEIG